jgi:hypothetical protein
MDNDDHFAMAGSGTGTLLLSTSILGGENSPPVEKGANDPGLNSSSIFSDETRAKVKKHWLWILIALVLALFAWKYFAGSPATA